MKMNTPLGERTFPEDLLLFPFTYCNVEDLIKPVFEKKQKHTIEWKEISGKLVTTVTLIKK